MSGPFTTGAIVQDRLIGRLSADSVVSPDQNEWLPFDAWPQLAAAIARLDAGSAKQDAQWYAERAKARARWADERTGTDRRASHEQAELSASQHPARRAERRTASGQQVRLSAGWLARSRKLIRTDRALLQIVIGVAIVAAMVATVALLYGPVNPVTVRIR